MNGVKFGTYHSYDDLGMILAKKTIGAAIPKTEIIEIPGADGELDYTEYFGKINFSNRILTFEFSTIDAPEEYLVLYSRIQALINGRKLNIYLDDDPGFYYVGRVSVDEWASNGRIGKIVINARVEPYKLKSTATVVSAIASGPTTINCHNLQKQAIPKITVSAEVTVAFGTYTRTFNGSITDDEIIFAEGQNVLTVTPTVGTVSVAIEYQEGAL